MGAKKIEIDWQRVTRFLQAQCSGVGIAGILGIHENTLYERCKTDQDMEFMAFSAKKKAEGKELLKFKQFETAMNGNVSMQIWLGKQYLGQRDQVESTVHLPQLVIQPYSPADESIIKEGLEFLEKNELN